MASILKFAARTGWQRMREPVQAAQSCEIVIFPGIRYERWGATDTAAPVAKPKRTRRRARRAKSA